MARDCGQRNGGCSGMPGNMAAIHSMAEVKQNENRTTSGLPQTSAVIWSSS